MIRTLKDAAAIIKAEDKDTPITENMLRRWCKSGDLAHVRAGNKYLIDMSTLETFLRGRIQ